jgi:hypothetical protein
MKEVTYKIKVDTKGAVKEVDQLNDSIKDTGKDAKNTQESLDTISGGAVGRFGALKGKITGVIKSFKSLRVAVIASGIGALLIAVLALQQAFTRSEAGQNKFAKLMGMIGAVVNEVLDLFADLGEGIIKAFKDPKKAIEDFAKLIKDNITTRFEGLAELIPELGKAISLLFELKFKEAAKVAANATAKVTLGVENIVEKTQDAINKSEEFIKKLEEETRIAAKIADDRAKADKIERKNTVERAKADREIADLRFKAEQRDKFTVSERIKFLEEASALEENITNQEIEAARLRFEAKKAENDLGKSTKEDLDEVAQLEAKLIGLNTSKLRLQKRLQTSLTTFRNEEKAEREAARKAEADAQKLKEDLRKKNEKEEAIARENKRIADEKAQQEELKREEQQWNLLQKITNTAQEQELLELAQEYDKKFQLAEGNKDLILALQEQQQKDSAAIDDKYNKERLKASNEASQKIIDKNNEDTQQKIENQNAILSATTSALSSIGQIADAFAGDDEERAKKAFNINKGLGIAQAIISTSQGIMNAYTNPVDVASGVAFAKSIAIGLAGAAQIATIATTEFRPSGGGSQSPTTSTNQDLTSTSQAPSFNVVGQSGFNQVAGALGQQQPVQAYVVAGAVTTQQQLNNAIVQRATF